MAKGALFIENLAFDAEEQDVLDLFDSFGSIEKVSMHTDSEGSFAGNATIHYTSARQAERAKDALHKSSLQKGRDEELSVTTLADEGDDGNIDDDSENRDRGRDTKNGSNETSDRSNQLFIGQIPGDARESEIRRLFEQCGEVIDLNVLHKDRSASCAFVRFETGEQAEAAIKRHNKRTHLPGAREAMVVRVANERKKKDGQQEQGNDRRRHDESSRRVDRSRSRSMSRRRESDERGHRSSKTRKWNGDDGPRDPSFVIPTYPASNVAPVQNDPGAQKRRSPPLPKRGDEGNQSKLFIGQVPYSAREEDLRPYFAPLGHIEDLYILKDADKRSKGCAFVTFEDPETAYDAIRELDQRVTLPGNGSNKPLVVRFAK